MKIPLTGGFERIPEGVHVFKITNVENKLDFGKVIVTLRTKEGREHIEQYVILDGKGQPNSGAMTAFSFFIKAAMDDFDLEEIDENDLPKLVGRYIRATVVHNVVESNKTPGKMITFVQLNNKESASGYEDEEDTDDTEDNISAGLDDGDDLLASILG